MAETIWTIGHSNRTIEGLVALLEGERIALVADVRRFPGSRRHPQFGREALAASLAGAGMGYVHFEALGGRRGRAAPGSPNTAWRVEAFNAYADHMATDQFAAALAELARLAALSRTAILCAEALPWQCHRRLIADALIVRGWEVYDIVGRGPARRRALTPMARVDGQRVTYPGELLLPG
jgi:uncharacterized protein (DUF488 family)